MKIYPKHSERVRLCDWLLGYDIEAPSNWRFKSWNSSKRRLGSPLAWLLGELNRFSLDRVWSLDISDAKPTDPRQIFLNKFQEFNSIRELAYSAVERGHVTGACYLFLWPHEDTYKVFLFDETEVTPMPESQGYWVQFKSTKGYKRWGFTATHYQEYQETKSGGSDWGEPQETPHNYTQVPGVAILHRIKDHSKTPVPEFDWVSLEMALEICAQTLGAAANYQYFGGPFLVSSDPKQTTLELMERRQVLTGRNSPEFQDTGIMAMPAMPPDHPEFLRKLAINFADYHGISWVPDTPPGDTSSLTLRILHSRTISRASKISENYLGSFQNLFKLVLQMAAIDGRIGYTEPEFSQGFENEVFPLTPQDKQQILMVVEQLVSLGVETSEALKEYWPGLTDDEINSKIMGA